MLKESLSEAKTRLTEASQDTLNIKTQSSDMGECVAVYDLSGHRN